MVLVPSEKREAAFDKAMVSAVESLEIEKKVAVNLPFFITSEQSVAKDGVLGSVWRACVPAPQERWLAPMFLSSRRSLLDIPAKKAGPFDVEPLGKKWTDRGVRYKLQRLPIPPTFPAGVPPRSFEEEGA